MRINGIVYTDVSELIAELGIARQTLWRWRREGMVPYGRMYRGQRIVFTPKEASQIREFAHRLEPALQLGGAGEERD